MLKLAWILLVLPLAVVVGSSKEHIILLEHDIEDHLNEGGSNWETISAEKFQNSLTLAFNKITVPSL